MTRNVLKKIKCVIGDTKSQKINKKECLFSKKWRNVAVSETKKGYRLEHYQTADNKQRYFLVRDINVNGKRTKIRKYLGTTRPSEKEIIQLSEKHSNELEERALKKEIQLSFETLKTNYLDPKITEKIEETRFMYKRFNELLAEDEIKTYEQTVEIQYIQGTTAIEGNTLTVEQAQDLLVNEKTPNDKTQREINEVQNFKKVKKFRDVYKGKINLFFIKKLHALIMDNIDYKTAGQFRTQMVRISGCDKQVTHPDFIELALQEIINNYYSAIKNKNHPFEEAILFHYKFETIHPFFDGNGRVGREILNFMLSKHEYPKILLLKSNRQMYLHLLQLGDEEKYQDMIVQFAWLMFTQKSTEWISVALKQIENAAPNFSYNLTPHFVGEWTTTDEPQKKSEDKP